MAVKTMEEMFVHELGDTYDAEHQFLDGMREMSEQVGGDIKGMLEEHIRETEEQIQNLERVYEALGQKAKRVKCDGAVGLVTEARKLLKETSGNPALQELAAASAWEKGEHYEMVSYRGLIASAEQMGNKDVVKLLQQNLKQEEKVAQRLEKSEPKLLKQAMGAEEQGK